jgi:hypothetical protein
MIKVFNERKVDAGEWDLIRHVLRQSAAFSDGTAARPPRLLGRHAELLIECAEYLEDAAQFLRLQEARLLEARR